MAFAFYIEYSRDLANSPWRHRAIAGTLVVMESHIVSDQASGTYHLGAAPKTILPGKMPTSRVCTLPTEDM